MKKRFISMLLAFIICISFVVPVSAVSGSGGGTSITNSPFTCTSYLPFEYWDSNSFSSFGGRWLCGFKTSKNYYVLFSISSAFSSLGLSVNIQTDHTSVSPSGNYLSFEVLDSFKRPDYSSYDRSEYRLYITYGSPVVCFLNSSLFTPAPQLPEFDDSKNDYYALGIDAIGFSEWLHEHPEFFDTLKKNFPNFHWDDDVATTKFLMQWWNAYGGRTDAMIENFQELVDLGLVDEDSIPLPPSPDYMWSLSSQIQKQYNKYNESQQSTPVPNPQQPIVIDTPNYVSPSESDSVDVAYLKEIIRLLVLDINNDSSYNYEINTNLGGINNVLNGFVPVINGIAGGIGSIAGGIANINTQLGDLILKLGDGGNIGCNYDESFWERMLIPTFSDFDEMQALFLSKFPIMNDIATISIDGDSTTITNNLPDKELDSMLETGIVPLTYHAEFPTESQNPYSFEYSESDITTKDLFSFTMPTGTNTWMDAFNGMSVSIINFKKFNTAISFFKGIISVLAIFAFSKWLLQFVPKIATGASTGD